MPSQDYIVANRLYLCRICCGKVVKILCMIKHSREKSFSFHRFLLNVNVLPLTILLHNYNTIIGAYGCGQTAKVSPETFYGIW